MGTGGKTGTLVVETYVGKGKGVGTVDNLNPIMNNFVSEYLKVIQLKKKNSRENKWYQNWRKKKKRIFSRGQRNNTAILQAGHLPFMWLSQV